MKYFYTALCFLSIVLVSVAQVSKSVYFLGNSYTDYYNLPGLIKDVALSANDDLYYIAHAPGGQSLEGHLKDTQVLSTIANEKWDYVVLQEQSQRPTFGDSYTFPFAKQLSDLIKKSSPCANVMFYMTWGYKNGDEQNCKNGLKQVCTYEGMDDKLADSYVRMAKANKGVVSPVGKVRRAIRQKYPQMELYDGDGSHPSYLGAMVAAYTFYTSIFRKDPTLASFNGNLSASEVAIIKDIVKEVVYNDLKKWDYTSNSSKAKFTYDDASQPSISFSSIGTQSDELLWDFGDGKTSILSDPTHTYTKSGNYLVTLTITVCGEKYSYEEIVTVVVPKGDTNGNDNDNGATEPILEAGYVISPNPTTDNLYVYLPGVESAYVFDKAGKQTNVKPQYRPEYYKLDVRHLAHGIYILYLETKQGSFSFRFVKK